MNTFKSSGSSDKGCNAYTQVKFIKRKQDSYDGRVAFHS